MPQDGGAHLATNPRSQFAGFAFSESDRSPKDTVLLKFVKLVKLNASRTQDSDILEDARHRLNRFTQQLRQRCAQAMPPGRQGC